MKMRFVLGDWSNDGHGQTETFIVELPTVVDENEVNEFYKLGTNIVGFNYIEEVARHYDDNTIDKERYQRLQNLSYVPYQFKRSSGKYEWNEEVEIGDEVYYITSNEVYLDMYMFVIALGYKQKIGANDSFMYQIVGEEIPCMNIGGYGLFY